MFRTKRRYAEEGLNEVLRHHNQVDRYQKMDDRVETHVIALACSPAPGRHGHWTLRALAGNAMELGLVESLSHETVLLHLKKRAQAVAEAAVVRPWRTSWSFTPSPAIPRGWWSDLHATLGRYQGTIAGAARTLQA